ncbi:hypothetical protein HL653_00820 [Sphingomonas sp. AP4-R1]|uniref:hypothetical protein n=1 Tax=Sphingomonas sp. AP4-R1 TaxID=2735134 RepID=UPI001493474F|nr:hypothetical protein [Sphingomonas sp. AP4-R1]QJU56519.1 hypothetical protein HL653_00820 [Sphingomonas sp. AP4-R1]
MAEQTARRQEIERLRRRAERHRQVAQGLGSEDDARAAQDEAMAVELMVARLERELREMVVGAAALRASPVRSSR